MGVANPKLTEEELEAQSADPEQAKALLNQQLLGEVHEKVKSTIEDIEMKYQEILVLEKSVMAVHQMFDMLSGLVQEQTEMLDNIEHNMQEAKNYVEKGEKNIILAKKWYQQTRTVFPNLLKSGNRKCASSSWVCSLSARSSPSTS